METGGPRLAALRRFGARADGVFDVFQLGLARHAELVVDLEFQPEFGGGAEVSCEAQGGVGGDAAAAAHDLVQTGGIHSQRFRELVHAHAERLEHVFPKDLSGVNRCEKFWHGVLH
jgi:hypothetical protein